MQLKRRAVRIVQYTATGKSEKWRWRSRIFHFRSFSLYYSLSSHAHNESQRKSFQVRMYLSMSAGAFFLLLFNSRLTQALYLCFRVFFSRICCTVFRVSLLFFYVSDSWLVVLVRKSFRFQFQLFYSFDLLISWLPFVLLSSTISHNHSLCVCVQ